MFENRNLLIATKHGKEKVLSPLLEKGIGVKCFVAINFDTDKFGTFTGESERILSPAETVKAKGKEALLTSNLDLVLASEGSFGKSFILGSPCNEEFLYFFDHKNNFELTVSSRSFSSNFNKKTVSTLKEFKLFLDNVKFPSHAIILKNQSETKMVKGITNYKNATLIFEEFLEEGEYVTCETDMRAMFNPTRMKHIQTLASDLVKTLQNKCSKCAYPGLQITSVIDGLPCAACGTPSLSPLSHIYTCKNCHYQIDKKFPEGKKNEDPQFCDLCNP